MSREIKFRAWSKKDKRMVYLAHNEMSSTHLQMNNRSWGIFEPDEENYCGGATFNNHFGDILMQYTGLKDKNGVEIYEGDIVTGKLGKIAEVKWLQEHCSFVGYCREDNQYYFLECGNDKFDNILVVGNIYEKSELLNEVDYDK